MEIFHFFFSKFSSRLLVSIQVFLSGRDDEIFGLVVGQVVVVVVVVVVDVFQVAVFVQGVEDVVVLLFAGPVQVQHLVRAAAFAQRVFACLQHGRTAQIQL